MIIAHTIHLEMAHRLMNYPGKCARLHGHRYELTVEAHGPVNPSSGFVIDIADLKSYVHATIDTPFDHMTLLENIDPIAQCLEANREEFKVPSMLQLGIFTTGWPPSVENIATYFAERLETSWPFPNCRLGRVILHETAANVAVWLS